MRASQGRSPRLIDLLVRRSRGEPSESDGAASSQWRRDLRSTEQATGLLTGVRLLESSVPAGEAEDKGPVAGAADRQLLSIRRWRTFRSNPRKWTACPGGRST